MMDTADTEVAPNIAESKRAVATIPIKSKGILVEDKKRYISKVFNILQNKNMETEE